MDISRDSVSNILKDNNINPKEMLSDRCEVIMLDKENNPIKLFVSYAEAARWLIKNNKCNCKESGLRSHIADVCNGKRKTVANYKWKKI